MKRIFYIKKQEAFNLHCYSYNWDNHKFNKGDHVKIIGDDIHGDHYVGQLGIVSNLDNEEELYLVSLCKKEIGIEEPCSCYNCARNKNPNVFKYSSDKLKSLGITYPARYFIESCLEKLN